MAKRYNGGYVRGLNSIETTRTHWYDERIGMTACGRQLAGHLRVTVEPNERVVDCARCRKAIANLGADFDRS